MNDNFQAFGNCIIVRRAEEETTPTGIVTVGDLGTNVGMVVSVGPGTQLENGDYMEVPLSVGQKIIFGVSFSEVEINREKYLVMGAENVFVTLS